MWVLRWRAATLSTTLAVGCGRGLQGCDHALPEGWHGQLPDVAWTRVLPSKKRKALRLVPLDCPLYDEYATVRRSITLLPSDVHRIQASNQACSDFGIHPRLPFLKQLYDQGQVTFVNDVGSLVEPLSKDQIGTGFHAKGGSGEICQGLFSHADQQRAAETLTCASAAS